MKKIISFLSAVLVFAGFLGFSMNFAHADVASLTVTSITPVQVQTIPNGTPTNGWKWIFKVTLPTSEDQVKMKFSDWTSGSDVVAAANTYFYSPQTFNPDFDHALHIGSANTYSGTLFFPADSDLDVNMPGRQVEITVEVRVPVDSAVGSYSTTYGILSFISPDTIAPTIRLLGANPQIITLGSPYTELGAVVEDNRDANLVPVIDVSHVNTSIVGDYTVTYDAVDASGNHAPQITRTVRIVPPIVTFPITTTVGPNGSISPSGSVNVAQGTDQVFTITRNSGYQIASLTVDGVSKPAQNSYPFTNFADTYMFTNVTAPHTISVTFQSNASDGVWTNFGSNIAEGRNILDHAVAGTDHGNWAQADIDTYRIAVDAAFAVWNNPTLKKIDYYTAFDAFIKASTNDNPPGFYDKQIP